MAPMKRPVAADPDDTISLTALARRWHIKQREVRWLLGNGAMPFVQLRGHIRVPRDAVAELERRWMNKG